MTPGFSQRVRVKIRYTDVRKGKGPEAEGKWANSS